jgi:hypothetical protein
MRTTHGIESSRMSRQFIHRKANCMNSTPWSSRWFASSAAVEQAGGVASVRDDAERRQTGSLRRTIDPRDELGHLADRPDDAWLGDNVVVVHAREHPVEAPERVGLDGREGVLGQERHVESLWVDVWREKGRLWISAVGAPAAKVNGTD